jgi:hypothetical protein
MRDCSPAISSKAEGAESELSFKRTALSRLAQSGVELAGAVREVMIFNLC